MKIFASDFNIVEFFPYPSIVLYPISIYDDMWHKGKGDPWVKDFFERILNMAEVMYDQKFMDNKIAFHITHKNVPNSSLYVGYKDGIYRIGLLAKNMDNISPVNLEDINKLKIDE